jgi:PAS domain S-box-containing protein
MSGRADDGRIDAESAPSAEKLERAQEQLRQNEELYRSVIELSNLMPWAADGNGRVVEINKRWREWTGAPRDRALGIEWLEFVHPDDRDKLVQAWTQAVWTGRGFEHEWRVLRADGSYRWCRSRAAKRNGETSAGDVVWYGTVEDVHERHQAEEAYRKAQAELVQVSRLSAMGTMASAIAHDINQPLTATAHYVRGCKRLLGRIEGGGKADLVEALEEADRSIVRAADIVRRVREFVTRGTIEAQREKLLALIEDACRFAMLDSSASLVDCRVRADADCFVMADRVQVRQVLVNLIRNSVVAMEGCPQKRIVIRAGPGSPGYCEVSVSDTGIGIPPEAVERLFEPLYTTRKDGMGVGLPICRTIIEAHGGAIWVDQEVERGATIRFTLPTASIEDARIPKVAG